MVWASTLLSQQEYLAQPMEKGKDLGTEGFSIELRVTT